MNWTREDEQRRSGLVAKYGYDFDVKLAHETLEQFGPSIVAMHDEIPLEDFYFVAKCIRSLRIES